MKPWSVLGIVGAALALNAASLNNPGFEMLNDSRDFPASWGKHWVNKGEFALITDPAGTHGGSIALSISHSGEAADGAWATVGSERLAPEGDRRYRLRVWAKGHGELGMITYLYGSGNYLVPQAPQDDFYVWFTVDSDQYREFEAEFTVPAQAISGTDGAPFAVDQFEVLFHVKKGPVVIDDVSLTHPGETVTVAEQFFDPAQAPLITLPQLQARPVMDGRIDDAAWQGAAMTTGMQGLDGVISPRQCRWLAGFDEENLYIAFESRQHALMLAAGATGRDVTVVPDVEAVEIWLQVPGQPLRQFIGVPAGGLATVSPEPGFRWGENVEFASYILESSEMAGGILTLGDKVWTGEIRIPFRDLGGAAPADGSMWRINFCRDFSVPSGAARADADWTTWAPIRTLFSNVGEFGFARFDRNAPVVQLQSVGDPASGALVVQGSASKPVQLSESIRLTRLDKQVTGGVSDLGAGAFRVEEAIRTNAVGVTPMRMQLAVKNPADGMLLTQTGLNFQLLPTFWIRSRMLFSQGILMVDVDASRSELPADCTVEVGIFAGGENTPLAMAAQPVQPGVDKFTIPVALESIPAGSYLLKGVVKTADGKEAASTAEPLEIPARPAWMGNRIGYSETVPPPFTPVRVEGQSVEVVLRNYLLDNNGFPAQIEAADKELMAAPVRLEAVVDGKPVTWDFAPLRQTAADATKVVYAVSGSSKVLDVTGTVTVEFDGFAVWDATFTPKGAVTVDELKLVAPLRKDVCYFARGDGFVAGSLLQDAFTTVPGREDIVTLGNTVTEWGSWSYCRTGWAWPETFYNEVYVGTDEVGFSMMAEGAANIRGPKYASFVPAGGDTMEMTIHLISEATKWDKPWHYAYFYQAMPLRPEPTDPKEWHVSYDPSDLYASEMASYQTPAAQELFRNLYIGMGYYMLDPDGFPAFDPNNREAAERGLKYFQSFGTKIVHNLWFGAIADRLPAYQTFGAEWDALPKFGWSTPMSHLTSACLNSGYQDFQISCIKGIVDDLGFDGVYTDATPIQCSNGIHGCGYDGIDGKRHTTLNLLATRNFVKRMYNVLKADGRDRVNFSHSGEGGTIGAFNDARTHGEEICWEGADHYRRITPDYFRAKYAQTEYGVPYAFFPVFYYTWRAVGEPTPISEAMMMALAHRLSVTIAHNQPEMLAIWRLFDPWWTSSDFVVYWKPEAPVQTERPLEVTASTFLKKEEGKALVVLSNWAYQDVDVAVLADSAKLGFTPSRYTLIDVIAETESELDPAGPRVQIPARDFRALLVEK